MNARGLNWVMLGAAAVVLATGLGLQRQRVVQLRAEVALRQEEQRECARLQAEHDRLSAAQPDAEEWARLRAERLRLAQAQSEIARLTSQLAAGAAVRLSTGEVNRWPAGSSRNAGCASPETTLETALWAVMEGDVGVLAQTLALEPPARARAETLLAGLPAAARAGCATPEQLVALLTMADVPVGDAELIGKMERADGDVLLRVRVKRPDGGAVTRSLAVRRQAGDWRFVVPENAVARYEEMLKGPATAATP